jgi:WD40 repeat protein
VDSREKYHASRGEVTLYDLAMDCLRLSMHFFHPIQQCAQQVYYTALPLSPTSSVLRDSYVQNVIDNQLSRITTFSRPPYEWGVLLRTIVIRPGRVVCIATSGERIIAACEDITNIYDAVTFVLQQSLHIPETVTKIQDSLDGSTLFFAHSHSVTMWDVQTGGLTHTFTARSEINDITVSTTGDHIACGSSDGSIKFWNIHTKEEGEGFGNGQPVVAIFWLSPSKLAVATQGTVYTHDIGDGETLGSFSIPGRVWGMVHSPSGGDELLVGTLRSGEGEGWDSRFFRITASKWERTSEAPEPEPLDTRPLVRPGEELSSLMLVGGVVVWITLPRGVRLFDPLYGGLMQSIPPLDRTTSVAVSLNGNIVAQTEDFLQIFTSGVLGNREARNDIRTSHVYPLGGKHIVCLLQPDRHLTILELETLRKLHPNDYTSFLLSLPINLPPSARASFSRGLVAEFGIPVVMQAWRSGTPLPEWAEGDDKDPPLSGLSPDCTRIVTFYGSPRWELRVKDAKDGMILAILPLGDDGLEMGRVYDVIFDSETGFHLEADGPGGHVQTPYDIVPSPPGPHSHTITKGEPVVLSGPREIPPYTLDVNCEWVVDAESRKICWISPGNVRRGNGGHFWNGLSLVMVGGDGVVRKVSFKEPGC